jgi:hypothetical protein
MPHFRRNGFWEIDWNAFINDCNLPTVPTPILKLRDHVVILPRRTTTSSYCDKPSWFTSLYRFLSRVTFLQSDHPQLALHLCDSYVLKERQVDYQHVFDFVSNYHRNKGSYRRRYFFKMINLSESEWMGWRTILQKNTKVEPSYQ